MNGGGWISLLPFMHRRVPKCKDVTQSTFNKCQLDHNAYQLEWNNICHERVKLLEQSNEELRMRVAALERAKQ